MKEKWMTVSLLAIFVVILSSSCATSTASPTPVSPTSTLDGATLVQERCTKCHPLSRVESVHYSAAEWKTIVDLMISRGAQLTPDEETIVVSYLAANFGQ